MLVIYLSVNSLIYYFVPILSSTFNISCSTLNHTANEAGRMEVVARNRVWGALVMSVDVVLHQGEHLQPSAGFLFWRGPSGSSPLRHRHPQKPRSGRTGERCFGGDGTSCSFLNECLPRQCFHTFSLVKSLLQVLEWTALQLLELHQTNQQCYSDRPDLSRNGGVVKAHIATLHWP